MAREQLIPSITTYLVSHPERVFELPILSYRTAEIEDIIYQMQHARVQRLCYLLATNLLHALVEFRHDTMPAPAFVALRIDTKSEKDLKLVFCKMCRAWRTALCRYEDDHMSQVDRNILLAAISYTKCSILERISNLNINDPLLKIWQTSVLKKSLD